MNNQTALLLGIVLALCLIIDWAAFGGVASLYIGRQWLWLIDWLAVWR